VADRPRLGERPGACRSGGDRHPPLAPAGIDDDLTRPLELRSATCGSKGIGCASRSGPCETWFRVHPPGLAFDAGRGALKLAGARDLFLTHGHLDHALGVPYVLSQRSLHQLAGGPASSARPRPPRPRSPAPPAGAWSRPSTDFELVRAHPGDRVEVGRDLRRSRPSPPTTWCPASATTWSAGQAAAQGRTRRGFPARARPPARARARRSPRPSSFCLSYCGDTGPGLRQRAAAVQAACWCRVHLPRPRRSATAERATSTSTSRIFAERRALRQPRRSCSTTCRGATHGRAAARPWRAAAGARGAGPSGGGGRRGSDRAAGQTGGRGRGANRPASARRSCRASSRRPESAPSDR
jgi:hypothetical protein